MTYTHYDYLELAPGANALRIEAAYAAILERFQFGMTDAGQDLSGLVRMIHSAYEILSDPQRRERYDAELTRSAQLADQELRSMLDDQANTTTRLVQDVPFALRAAVAPLAA